MKKSLLIILTIIASHSINAQLITFKDVGYGYLYLGPKAGMHGSWVSNVKPSGSNTKILLGHQFGIVGKIGITEKLAIQPELLFTRKGSKHQSTGAETKSIANYIGIPILAKISVIKIGDLMLHGSGGVYSNITTSVVTKSTFGDHQHEEKVSKSEYKTVDFGFSFGGGVTYDMGHGLLVGELTIEHGFVDMYENSYVSESNRNTTVGINMAYLFDFAEMSARLLKK